MHKKIIGLLLAGCCLVAFAGCGVTEPTATMRAPAAQAAESGSTTKEVLNRASKFLPKGAELLEISGFKDLHQNWLEADLTGDGAPELVLCYLDQDNKVGALVLQRDGRDYKKLYLESFACEDHSLNFDKQVRMKTAQLMDSGLPQVVISYDYYGADYNSLSFHVLGYDAGEKAVKRYFSLTDLPKAGLEVQGDRLVVDSMGVYKEYKWDGSSFKGEQIFRQPQVKDGDVVVHYAMSKEGPLTVSTDRVDLKVGQRLVLTRLDQLNQQERIMEAADGRTDILQYISRNIYVAENPGTMTMTIVPNGGYDWDHAKEIKITVN